MSEPMPATVFISYAHADEPLKNELLAHLAPLKLERLIGIWHDREMVPGVKFEDTIQRELASSDLVLLLISSDFLASDYCAEKELMRALELNTGGRSRAVPIIVRTCQWRRVPLQSGGLLGDVLALPQDAKPVTAFPDRDVAWDQVASGVRARLTETGGASTAKGTTSPPDQSAPLIGKEDLLASGARLIERGAWRREAETGSLVGSRPGTFILSDQNYGAQPFLLLADLRFNGFEKPKAGRLGMNAGIVLGWREDASGASYWNLLITGSDVLLERVGVGHGTAAEHVTAPVPLSIISGRSYRFELSYLHPKLVVRVDGREILTHHIDHQIVGRIGLRPWRSELRCTAFTVETSVG